MKWLLLSLIFYFLRKKKSSWSALSCHILPSPLCLSHLSLHSAFYVFAAVFIPLTYCSLSPSQPLSSYTFLPWILHLLPSTLIPSLFCFCPYSWFLILFLWFLPFLVPDQFSTPFFLPITLQGRETSGSGHVKSQAGSVHLCSGVSVPELLRADSCLQPAHCQASAAAHQAARVLRPGAACTYTHTHKPRHLPSHYSWLVMKHRSSWFANKPPLFIFHISAHSLNLLLPP